MSAEGPSLHPPEKTKGIGFNRITRLYFVFPLIIAPIGSTCLVLLYFSTFWDNSIPIPLLMLAPHAMILQLPFVIFASLSALKFLGNPKVECHSPLTRWGIGLGVMVGFYFTGVVLIAEYELDGNFPWDIYKRACILLLVFLGLLLLTLPWLSVRFQDFLEGHQILFLALMLAIHFTIGFVRGFEAAIFWPMILLRFAGPWYLAAQCCLTFAIWRHWIDEDGPDEGRSLIDYWFPSGLISTFFLSGFASFQIAKHLKSTLPPPPECFIATAAAQGHPAIVRSWAITDDDGRTRRVNRQLLTLKEFEWWLMRTFPRSHRILRAIYNWVGPVGAWMIRPKGLADLAYLALKPVEWVAWLVVR